MTRRERARIAAAIAAGRLSLPKARRLFGVASLIGGAP